MKLSQGLRAFIRKHWYHLFALKPKFTFFLLQTLKEEGRGGGMENEVSSHGTLLSFWCKIYSIY